MSNKYYVTSDNINKKERQYINKVIQKLESNGHTCINGGVGPNQVQHYGLSKKSKGMIGIQIVGGRCGWTSSDCVNGIKKGYYHYDHFYFCGCKEFGTGTHITANDMNTKMYRAHDAGKGLENMYVGVTPNEFNERYGKYFTWILTDSFEDLLNTLVGSDSSSSDDSSQSTSGGGGSTTYKTGIDSIKDLIAPWDAEVEVKIRGDIVQINKINSENPNLVIQEGFNMVNGSLNLHDYNPDTINVLNAKYGGKTVSLVDDYLSERFGIHEHTVEAKKVISSSTEGDITNDTSTATDSTSTTTDSAVGTDNQTSTKRKVSYSEVPITDKKEAIEFVKREWNKVRRGNGHQLELKVLGTNLWQTGEWCRVYIPNFNEDGLMYVTKTQHSASPSEEWLTSLTLIDYPPKLSEVTQQAEDENDTKEDDKTVAEGTGDDTNISDGSGTV